VFAFNLNPQPHCHAVGCTAEHVYSTTVRHFYILPNPFLFQGVNVFAFNLNPELGGFLEVRLLLQGVDVFAFNLNTELEG